MARIAGIKLEKVSLILPKENNFNKKFKKGITGNELIKRVSTHIDQVWKEKYE